MNDGHSILRQISVTISLVRASVSPDSKNGVVRRVVCLFWVIVMVGVAEAQWKPTRHFTVKDGLVQSQISAIDQDADGFLWIATEAGLCRFDGKHFRHFTRTNGLPDSVLADVAAHGNEVWAATERGGLVVWDGKDLEQVTNLPLEEDELLTGVQILEDGTVIVSSQQGVLAGRSGSWRRISQTPVWEIRSGSQGSIIGVGMNPFSIDDGLVLRDLVELDDSTELVAVAASPSGAWIASKAGRIAHISAGIAEWTEIEVSGQVITMLSTKDGTGLWIGTTHGLWFAEGGRAAKKVSLLPRPAVLEITDLFEDREGNVWVGTWGGGLFQIPPTSWTHFTLETGFPAQSAWSFSEDQEGCVWMATTDAGVVSWCGDRWGPQLTAANGLPSSTVYSIAHDSEGALWLGTTAGVCRARGQDIHCWAEETGPLAAAILQILPARDGGMWVATESGLARWRGSSWQFWQAEQGLPGEIVRALTYDEAGRLWMAIDSVGVVSFDGLTFSVMSSQAEPAADRVWTVKVGSRGDLLIGTDHGLWIEPIEPGRPPTIIGVEQGLPYPAVLCIIEDHEERIWAGTTHGVALIAPEGEVKRIFTAHDGFSGSESAEGSAFRDSTGKLWFGMSYGVTVVDPSALQPNETKPHVVLESVLANDSPIDGLRPGSTSQTAEPLRLRIEPWVTHLRFDYTAPSFVAPEMVRFRLALTCYGDDFGPPSDERHVTFHQLPAGRYRFGILAENNDGVASSEPLWVELDVRPPWYRTRWFQALAILCGALLGAGIFHLRTREQRRRQAWLEEEVEKRTKDLDAANHRINEQNRQLTELSRTDHLTGLGNRRVLAETLPVEMSILHRKARSHDPRMMVDFQGAVVLLMDIDHFKTINDQWGHDAGDTVLKACAEILEAELREGDQAVRWGGDEFVVLSRNLDRAGALGLARRVLECFAGRSIELPRGGSVALSATFGFVQIPLGVSEQLPGEQWQRYVDLADRLLYLGKNQGRGRALGLVWSPDARNIPAERDVVVSISNDPTNPVEGFELVEIMPEIS